MRYIILIISLVVAFTETVWIVNVAHGGMELWHGHPTGAVTNALTALVFWFLARAAHKLVFS